jgi:hypothetical protein
VGVPVGVGEGKDVGVDVGVGSAGLVGVGEDPLAAVGVAAGRLAGPSSEPAVGEAAGGIFDGVGVGVMPGVPGVGAPAVVRGVGVTSITGVDQRAVTVALICSLGGRTVASSAIISATSPASRGAKR